MEILIKGSNRKIWSRGYSKPIAFADIIDRVLEDKAFRIYQKSHTKAVTTEDVTCEVLKKLLSSIEHASEEKLRAAIKALQ